MSIEYSALNHNVTCAYQADDLQFYEIRLREYRAIAGSFFYPVGADGVPAVVGCKPKNMLMRHVTLQVLPETLLGAVQPGAGRRFSVPVGSQTRWEEKDAQTLVVYDGLECGVVGKTREEFTWL